MLSLALSPAVAQTLPPLQLVDQAGQPVSDVVARVEQSQTSAAQEGPDVAVMDQVNLSFSPKVIAISTGTRVQFPNSDETRHHVYSFSPAKTFELQLFRGNEAPPVEFDKAGLVVIGCNIHDAMLGYIYVTDGQVYGVTDAEGGLTLPTFTAPDSAELVLWHPDLDDTLALPLAGLDTTVDLLRIELPMTQRQAEPEPAGAAGGLRSRLQQFKTNDN
ncbi:MAG: methylamine utilization protein [Pseudohongiellaceae bacterium]